MIQREAVSFHLRRGLKLIDHRLPEDFRAGLPDTARGRLTYGARTCCSGVGEPERNPLTEGDCRDPGRQPV